MWLQCDEHALVVAGYMHRQVRGRGIEFARLLVVCLLDAALEQGKRVVGLHDRRRNT